MRHREKIKKKEMPKLKKEYRLKEKIIAFNRKIWPTLIVICIIGLGFTSFKMFYWSMENKRTDKQVAKIEEIVQIKEVNEEENDNLNVEIVNPPQEEEIPPEEDETPTETPVKPNAYWDYIKLPLLDVNISDLKMQNSDTVAFLKVNGTNINYPVVKTTNNDYYLNHSFDKSYNTAGWVFMDYRNNVEDFDDNTIIYAHGRANSTMFGSLKNIIESKWYENTDNYVVHLSLENENTLWQVISVYQIPMETYYLTSDFKNNTEEHQKFLDTIMSRSIYDFNTTVNTNDKILTLSTCYNKTNRMVLRAKLIKKASTILE